MGSGEAGKRGASFEESYWAKENRVVVGREVGSREMMCRGKNEAGV